MENPGFVYISPCRPHALPLDHLTPARFETTVIFKAVRLGCFGDPKLPLIDILTRD